MLDAMKLNIIWDGSGLQVSSLCLFLSIAAAAVILALIFVQRPGHQIPNRSGSHHAADCDLSRVPLRVAFLHPDLGLGGAERLVVDAACELSQRGHHVTIFTAHYDPSRCFEETLTGAFRVTTAGTWFPRSIRGRAFALCAYIRCLIVATDLAWTHLPPADHVHVTESGVGANSSLLKTPSINHNDRQRRPIFDVIIVDQVSAVVPLLKLLLPRSKVLFYCHFPDLLLASRPSLLHSLYRAPLDFVEQVSTGMAHRVLVNSAFTAGVFASTFSRLAAAGVVPQVLHPAVMVPSDEDLRESQSASLGELGPEIVQLIQSAAGGPVFVSVNRFERKKGLALALQALALLAKAEGNTLHHGTAPQQHGQAADAASHQASLSPTHTTTSNPPSTLAGAVSHSRERKPVNSISTRSTTKAKRTGQPVTALFVQQEGVAKNSGLDPQACTQAESRNTPRTVLVFAGGYDVRLSENVEHLAELKALAIELGVADRVAFLTSFTDRQRTLLFAAATAVLYTPQREHFGIVPLEAMAAARPVIACNSGGPLESIVHGTTGLLVGPDPQAWATAMGQLSDPGCAGPMGLEARRHVGRGFSRGVFGGKLEGVVREMLV